MSRRALQMAVALPLLVAAPAWAVGTITGLSANPPGTIVGNSIDFTAEGTGTCDLTIDFGDGESATFENAVMPRTIPHLYATFGLYTVTVTAPDCPVQGSNGVKVLVRLRIEQVQEGLTSQIDRAPLDDRELTFLGPTIVRAFGWGIQPGSGLLVGGGKFGTEEGILRIVGGDGDSKSLAIEHWFDDAIGGVIPDDVHDICVVGVQVETASGELSNVFPVQVPMTVKPLPRADVEVVACGDDADQNSCNNVDTPTEDIFGCVEAWHVPFFGGWVFDVHGSIQEGELVGPDFVPPSVVGSHRNCWAGFADDSGTDRYQITLRNGWVLDSAEFASGTSGGPDEGSTTPPSGTLPAGFRAGASSWSPAIEWSVTPNDTLAYGLTIFIRGPSCSSHK